MYFCKKRELNCLKRLILQRLIYIILMDSNNLTPLRKGVVGVQFLFVAFGATVLVPLLVGLDPSTALFTAGIGTLIFHAVTRGKVPIFLGSSFAFIAPIIKATEFYGLPGALSGMVGVALVYFVMSALVKWQGVRVIELYGEAAVSLRGNCSFLPWELLFPTVGTPVSCRGNYSFPLGNRKLIEL